MSDIEKYKVKITNLPEDVKEACDIICQEQLNDINFYKAKICDSLEIPDFDINVEIEKNDLLTYHLRRWINTYIMDYKRIKSKFRGKRKNVKRTYSVI